MAAKKSKHRGVKILTLSPGRTVARWADPITRKSQQVTFEGLGITNAKKRERWAIAKAKELQKLKAQVAIDGTTLGVRITVADAVAEYLTRFRNTNTVAAKELPLGEFVEFCAGRRARHVQDISPALLTAFGDYVRRPASPLATQSRNLRLAVCSAFLGWCRDGGTLPRVTLEQVRKALKREKVGDDFKEVMLPQQVRKLLQAVLAHDEHHPREHVAQFTTLMLLLGTRLDETLNLTWSEVDLAGAQVRLGAGRNKNAKARVIKLTETPAAIELLKALSLKGTTGRVFTHLTRRQTGTLRDRLNKHYGTGEFTWKLLRATCSSALVCAGVLGDASPFLVAKRAGHSLQTAQKYYLTALHDLPKNAPTLESALGIEAECTEVVRRAGGVVAGTRARASS